MSLEKNLAELQKLSVDELLEQRYEKFRRIGEVAENAAAENGEAVQA